MLQTRCGPWSIIGSVTGKFSFQSRRTVANPIADDVVCLHLTGIRSDYIWSSRQLLEEKNPQDQNPLRDTSEDYRTKREMISEM